MSQPVTSIRVAIVDDHAIVRQGLSNLLSQAGLEVVGEAANVAEALTLARDEQPDVMLLDIRLKSKTGPTEREEDGLTALPELQAASPATRIIVLTTYSNPTYFARAVQQGAAGFLVKDTEPDEIVAAIQSAAAHRHLFDPALLRSAMQPAETPSAPPPPDNAPEMPMPSSMESLSEREQEVLRWMAQGLSNADIAATLQVSVTTVKTHAKHIFRKLNARDRTQAVLIAMRHALV